ncbi:hypothetical protein SISNIDRAFT_470872 [Sistotremastrum niveocremeum HHB9708]|uniref:F-box domain-containing protein n=1 Tax=Sistotremastrum niveocremeum HHB9708 TaxID=1314777 RepID=A0A164NA89_9AGAM|nr:hypothetical protein SISNIDRAFT_470872 [Sistotremastrum niveocremeum HHB9708]
MTEVEESNEPSLLPEFYRPIAESLAGPHQLYSHFAGEELKALCSLAQTCRAFQYEAERIIFRDLLFEQQKSCPSELMDALQTRKAEYVEKITIMDSAINVQNRLKSARMRGRPMVYISYTTLPFDRMSRLRAIHISKIFLDKPTFIDRSLFQVLHEKLVENTLRSFSSSISLNSHELQFLLRQSNLTHLRLPSMADHPTLIPSPTFLPLLENLTIARGSIDHLLDLLKTRPVKCLVFEHIPNNFTMPNFPHRLEMIRLEIGLISPNKVIHFLEQRTRDCPNIQVLSFRLRLTLDSSASIKRNILSPLLHALEDFTHLQALHIYLFGCHISREIITDFFIDRTSSNTTLPRQLQTVLLVCKVKERNWSVELRREGGSDLSNGLEGTERWIICKTVDEYEWMHRWKNW